MSKPQQAGCHLFTALVNIMKKYFFLIPLIALCGCFKTEWRPPVSPDEMIEYRLQPGQYAVIVILDENIKMDAAKRAARHRAAELTVSGGFRYFLVQSETQIQVVKQKADAHDVELIILGDFAHDQIERSAQAFPALRMVIQCYEKRPNGKAIKACDLIDCSK